VEKHNQSTFDGFRNLRFHKFLLDKDPDGCIDMIRRLLDYEAQIKGPSRQDLGMGSGPGYGFGAQQQVNFDRVQTIAEALLD